MLHINFGETNKITLDKGWKLVPDPMGRCKQQKWWKSIRKKGYFFPSYDDDAFWDTKVPASYNIVHENLEFYEGDVVFLNKFSLKPADKNERIYLSFGAVNDNCEVFLNGKYLGGHQGCYQRFTFDITDVAQAENRLLIISDATRTNESVPGYMHDWFHFGGIVREVEVYYKPTVFVRDAKIALTIDGENAVIDLACLPDASGRLKKEIRFTLVDADGKIVFDETILGHCNVWNNRTVIIPLNKLNLWSPDMPYLYKYTVIVDDDIWTDTVGLREIRTEGKQILLNGQNIVLKGVAAWTADERGLFSIGSEMAKKTVDLLKDLHANFARAGHCSPSREFVKECDRRGILLWLETPAYWIDDMQRPARTKNAMNALSSMLIEYRNSPSAIIWSVGNECLRIYQSEIQNNLPYFIEAAEFSREHDPSRLVAFTGGFEGAGEENVEYPKLLIDKLDVIAINTYAGINDGNDEPPVFDLNYKKLEMLSKYNKPVMFAEIGIDAVLGEKGFDFGEQRQADFMVKVMKLFEDSLKNGTIQGLSVFALTDFRTPLKLGRYQKGYNRKGLLTVDFKPKKAYNVVKDTYKRI